MLSMQLPRDIFVFSFFSALLQSYQISAIVEKVKLNFEKLVKVAFFEPKLYLCLIVRCSPSNGAKNCKQISL